MRAEENICVDAENGKRHRGKSEFRIHVYEGENENGFENTRIIFVYKYVYYRQSHHSLGVERELTVHDGEHFLAQDGEKVLQHFDDVRVARVVILLQVAEQVLEQVRVLFVHHPVSLLEHVVEAHPRLAQHISEVLYIMQKASMLLFIFERVQEYYNS